MTDGFKRPRIKQAAQNSSRPVIISSLCCVWRHRYLLWWHFTSKVPESGFFCHILTVIAPFSPWNNDSQTLKACVCICFTLHSSTPSKKKSTTAPPKIVVCEFLLQNIRQNLQTFWVFSNWNPAWKNRQNTRPNKTCKPILNSLCHNIVKCQKTLQKKRTMGAVIQTPWQIRNNSNIFECFFVKLSPK